MLKSIFCCCDNEKDYLDENELDEEGNPKNDNHLQRVGTQSTLASTILNPNSIIGKGLMSMLTPEERKQANEWVQMQQQQQQQQEYEEEKIQNNEIDIDREEEEDDDDDDDDEVEMRTLQPDYQPTDDMTITSERSMNNKRKERKLSPSRNGGRIRRLNTQERLNFMSVNNRQMNDNVMRNMSDPFDVNFFDQLSISSDEEASEFASNISSTDDDDDLLNDQENQDLSCKICFHILRDAKKFSCNDSFCSNCLKKLVGNKLKELKTNNPLGLSQLREMVINCPLCLQPTTLISENGFSFKSKSERNELRDDLLDQLENDNDAGHRIENANLKKKKINRPTIADDDLDPIPNYSDYPSYDNESYKRKERKKRQSKKQKNNRLTLIVQEYEVWTDRKFKEYKGYHLLAVKPRHNIKSISDYIETDVKRSDQLFLCLSDNHSTWQRLKKNARVADFCKNVEGLENDTIYMVNKRKTEGDFEKFSDN
ncbi:hypothetical protein SNEBB_003723 [Seison nebaliae]|nr:hypothetical protein SNEBB_003723 [Seison nebaliae]